MVYTWLKTLNLLPDDIDSLAKSEFKANIKRISHPNIVDDRDLFEMIYLIGFLRACSKAFSGCPTSRTSGSQSHK